MQARLRTTYIALMMSIALSAPTAMAGPQEDVAAATISERRASVLGTRVYTVGAVVRARFRTAQLDGHVAIVNALLVT